MFEVRRTGWLALDSMASNPARVFFLAFTHDLRTHLDGPIVHDGSVQDRPLVFLSRVDREPIARADRESCSFFAQIEQRISESAQRP